MKRKVYSFFTLFSAFILGASLTAHSQTISTIAGGGIGDGSSATQAVLLQPYAVACDASGNLFIADQIQNRIRKVTPAGIITTVIGNGLPGFSGDGIQASTSRLNKPVALTFDRLGNLYIADNGNHRVRKVNTSGVITTVAGNGVSGFTGDAGMATNAEFDNITGVAVDSIGNIFIADQNNHRVRMVNTSGIVSTIAGSGSPVYSGDGGLATLAGVYPVSVAVDNVGDLFIGDANFYVREVTLSTDMITSIAGVGAAGYGSDGAPATADSLNYPIDIVYNSGNLYVADVNNYIVREINLGTGIMNIIAGTAITEGYTGDGGSALAAELGTPTSIAFDPSGQLFIADPFNTVVRKVDLSGNISTVAGEVPICCVGIPALSSALILPSGVCADIYGNVFIADAGSHVIRRINHLTGLLTIIAGTGVAGYSGDGAAASAAQLNTPTDITIDAFGNLYIADELNQVVREITIADGNINTIAGSNVAGYAGDGAAASAALLNDPFGVSLDATGNLYIADMRNSCIRKVDGTGIITTVAGDNVQGYNGDGFAATIAQLNLPTKAVVDNNGNMFIADMNNHRVREVTADGNIHTIAGNGIIGYSGDNGPSVDSRLDSPMSVALDHANQLYISDHGNNRVRIIVDTTIYDMVGNGMPSFSGDGGWSVAAEINNPVGLYATLDGHLYIADQDNQRIRFTTPYMVSVPQITQQANGIDLYPNPNQGTFTIQGTMNEAKNDDADIDILNSVGQLVYSNKITLYKGTFTQNISLGNSFAAGTYFVRVKSDAEYKTLRFTLAK